jgi:DNA invertase Pin-like site-specific DNA recombinase
MRSNKSIQKTYRSKLHRFDQYWSLSYTEKYKNGYEKDFRTIIKARSYSIAKKILVIKSEEDNEDVEIKAVQGSMFHKHFKIGTKTLGIKEWGQIQSACFPNENNYLFKINTPRASWKTNRFNGSGNNNRAHIKKYGFKSGNKNWAHINAKGKLTSEETTHKLWKGKWVDWEEPDREEKKQEIIDALIKTNNVRKEASRMLGIDRNTLYKLFKKFPEIDFKKEYPAPKVTFPTFSRKEYKEMGKKAWGTMKRNGTVPFNGKSFTPEANAKRGLSLKERARKFRIERFKKLEPQIRAALSANGNCRKMAAKSLNIPRATFCKYLHQMKKEMGINWSKEYPTKYAKSND